ncbi:hypothetical protein H8702_13405 [Massilimaliae timonensis]|uniref:DUF1492 domain-containing protein n=1 Tax=Massiliimalia timonensis TaxID=1987501 RepID=A0A8J6PA19_9FIRM|nr:hypothetical protein [Massiliimalia timonensis]MBC8612089.1 hypothetical protein [Massiliimalia timonensis]
MTNKELSQLYYLVKEIKLKRQQLEQLRTIAEGTTVELTGMPHGTGINDKVGNIAADIADIKAILELKIQEYYYQYNRLTRYIESIDDSLVRQIMTLRYIELKEWNDVADMVGGNNTEDSVKKRVYRYLDKQ